MTPPTVTLDGCPCGSGRGFGACCAEPLPGAERLTPELLVSWARARDVTDQLDVALTAVTNGRLALRGIAYASIARDLTVGVALAPGAALDGFFRRRALPLRLAAWEFLLEAVASASEALAAEVRPPPPPADPTLALLYDRLGALREVVRRTASPRAVARLGHCFLSVRPADGTLHFHERRRWIRSDARGSIEPALQLSLARVAEEPLPIPTCSCGADRPCTHLLAAIDLARVQLADPLASAPWAALARERDTPDWGRALAGLDVLRSDRRYEDEAEVQVRYSFVIQDASADRATLLAYVHRRKRDGAFSKGKRLSPLDLREGPGPCPPEDRIALAALGYLAGRGTYSWAHGSAWSSYEGRGSADLLALAGHPRVSHRGHGGEALMVRAADLGLLVRSCERGGAELITTAAGRPLPANDVVERLHALRSGTTFLWHDPEHAELLLVRVADPEAMRLALGSLVRYGHRFPPEAEAALLERIGALQPVLRVAIAPELAGEEVAPSHRHVLRLGLRDTGLELVLLARALDAAPLHGPGEGPERLLALHAGRRVFARRDLAGERRGAEELAAALPLQHATRTRAFAWNVADDEAALALVEALRTLDRPDVTVEWVDPPPRVLRASRARQLRVQVRDRLDWFGLAGTVEVDGEEVELAVLLAALRDRRKIVRLKGGAWLAIGDELAERLAPLAQLSTPVADGVEIGPAAVGALDDLASDGAELDARGAFARLHARMREASRRTPRVPRAFKGKLREYQVEGFRWLARLSAWGAGAVLADDMGLGKTLQALALLCHRAELGPALVVAPTSVCANWLAEARRFAPSLKVSLFREVDRASAVAALGPGDVLVASYGLLTLDLDRFEGVRFATLVLDEAQAVKNAGTRRARAARAIEADFSVALSGTPVENHVGELWSLYRIAFPGLLGSWELFRSRFAAPIEQDGDVARRRALAATLRPFLLRRTKGEVARELPTRTEISIPVALSSGERRLYEETRLAAVARLAGVAPKVRPEQRRFQVLAAITELRLLACHPRLHDHASALPSSKLARFLALAAELADAGHRTLVFSQFTSHLALVREALDAAGASYLYLDGKTPPADRDRLVARFQAGEGQHFLISLKAGGTGLNLTAADYVIHLDPWWNPAVEDQATDRAHRIGQTRPVTVYRLVSEGTIEETIVRLHEEKRELAAGILDGMDAAGRLSSDELLGLIRSGPRDDGPTAEAAVDLELDQAAPAAPSANADRCSVSSDARGALAPASSNRDRPKRVRARRPDDPARP
jgi:superfamily II DNA or RNA helicase